MTDITRINIYNQNVEIFNNKGQMIKFTSKNGLSGVCYEYNNAGRIIKEEHLLGYTVTLEYGIYGKIKLRQCVYRDGRWIKWVYNDYGLPIRLEKSKGDWTNWEYNDRGIEISVTRGKLEVVV